MKEIKGSNFDNKAACDCFYYLFIFNFEFFELLGNWIIASGIWANIHRGKQFIYKQTVTKWFHTLTRCSCFCYIVIKTIWFNIKCVFATILKWLFTVLCILGHLSAFATHHILCTFHSHPSRKNGDNFSNAKTTPDYTCMKHYTFVNHLNTIINWIILKRGLHPDTCYIGRYSRQRRVQKRHCHFSYLNHANFLRFMSA